MDGEGGRTGEAGGRVTGGSFLLQEAGETLQFQFAVYGT